MLRSGYLIKIIQYNLNQPFAEFGIPCDHEPTEKDIEEAITKIQLKYGLYKTTAEVIKRYEKVPDIQKKEGGS